MDESQENVLGMRARKQNRNPNERKLILGGQLRRGLRAKREILNSLRQKAKQTFSRSINHDEDAPAYQVYFWMGPWKHPEAREIKLKG